jgi:hypothetical protein
MGVVNPMNDSFYVIIDRGPLALTDLNRMNTWHWLANRQVGRSCRVRLENRQS